MSKRLDLLEQVERLIDELNESVSRNSSLKDEQVIELSHRIDDLVISLSGQE